MNHEPPSNAVKAPVKPENKASQTWSSLVKPKNFLPFPLAIRLKQMKFTRCNLARIELSKNRSTAPPPDTPGISTTVQRSNDSAIQPFNGSTADPTK
jgi:hypothetical protein